MAGFVAPAGGEREDDEGRHERQRRPGEHVGGGEAHAVAEQLRARMDS